MGTNWVYTTVADVIYPGYIACCQEVALTLGSYMHVACIEDVFLLFFLFLGACFCVCVFVNVCVCACLDVCALHIVCLQHIKRTYENHRVNFSPRHCMCSSMWVCSCMLAACMWC